MQYVCSARGNNVNICVRILRNVYIFENSENFKISPILAIFKFVGQFRRSTKAFPNSNWYRKEVNRLNWRKLEKRGLQRADRSTGVV